jgi:hypothetical protein
VWARLLEAVSVTANAIPWLKLKAEGHQAGPTGGDTLATTTVIQRVNTEGGLAPAAGCDSPPDIGSKRFVPYQADYVFYKLNEL